MQARRLFSGATRCRKHRGRGRSLWREEAFLLHLLQRSVGPALSLKHSVAHWYGISCDLREAPRRRPTKLEQLEEPGCILLS